MYSTVMQNMLLSKSAAGDTGCVCVAGIVRKGVASMRQEEANASSCFRPRPHWGSLQRSPRPPSWIQGVLLLRGGAGGEGERGKGRGGREVIGGFRGPRGPGPPKKPKVAP